MSFDRSKFEMSIIAQSDDNFYSESGWVALIF